MKTKENQGNPRKNNRKSRKINETQGKPRKHNENQGKTMKNKENQ